MCYWSEFTKAIHMKPYYITSRIHDYTSTRLISSNLIIFIVLWNWNKLNQIIANFDKLVNDALWPRVLGVEHDGAV